MIVLCGEELLLPLNHMGDVILSADPDSEPDFAERVCMAVCFRQPHTDGFHVGARAGVEVRWPVRCQRSTTGGAPLS